MSGVLGVDVGGTFTDLVHWDGHRLTTAKEPSTPDDQSEGVLTGASRLAAPDRFLHGTTVATNALLEGRGAATALITSPGFSDLIEIGRQHRPSLYDSFADRSQPLVPRDLRFEAPMNIEGWAVPPELRGVGAVAVALLYGYERPAEEQAVMAAVRRVAPPDVPISLSSSVAPEFREFERTVTTVLNAYLSPETARYLDRLVEGCRNAGLPPDVLVMRSSGGLIPISEASSLPVSILLSGPAGGVTAAAALGGLVGYDRLISFDMGGTSTDVCRIEAGRPEVSYERQIAGYPCRMPSVAIHTVGAGGGSIARCDEGGALRVGPRSAGAVPGPAAYGRGGVEPTVTDANIVLGRISSRASLAGSLPIHEGNARTALGVLGGQLGLDEVAAALGVASVVEEVMAVAIRKVSVEEGADPRSATLVAFGGAGGLHATALARGLDMAGVIVPMHAGVFSALGLLLSPPRVDVAQSRLIREEAATTLEGVVDEVAATASERLLGATGSEPYRLDAVVDVRYLGQSHELAVKYPRGSGWEALARDFHAAHRERNGFARLEDPIEVVTIRAEAEGRAVLQLSDVPGPEPVGDATLGSRRVMTAQGPADATVVLRKGLAPGDEVVGPAVIEEREATTYLAASDRAVVQESGALEIEW